MPAIGTSNPQVRAALWSLLSADAPLLALGMTGVFDIAGIPKRQLFPYIVLGEMPQEKQDDTFGLRGYDAPLLIHLWDESHSSERLYKMLGRLNVLLHRQQLTLSSQANVGIWYVNSMMLPEPEGIILHLTARYRIYTQEAL